MAFVLDLFARSVELAGIELRSDRPLDALEQALHAHRDLDQLVHQRDRGVQYESIRYTEPLSEAAIEPSVGSVGDSYDNDLAQTIIGLCEAEVIRGAGSWRGLEGVAFPRLLSSIGDIPPAEVEALYHQNDKSATPELGLN